MRMTGKGGRQDRIPVGIELKSSRPFVTGVIGNGMKDVFKGFELLLGVDTGSLYTSQHLTPVMVLLNVSLICRRFA